MQYTLIDHYHYSILLRPRFRRSGNIVDKPHLGVYTEKDTMMSLQYKGGGNGDLLMKAYVCAFLMKDRV
jgi:hypothetical protein